jgi:DNA primase
MGKFLDFQQLKEEFDFDDAIQFLGLKLSPENNQLRGQCPVCNTGGKRGLVITPGRGYYCFGAKKGGDQIALVGHVKGIGMRDAGELVQAQYDTENRTATSTVPDKRHEPTEKPPESKGHTGMEPLDYLQHDHEMVAAIGLIAADAETLGIGYAAKGVHRGLVAIPVRLEDGTLCGYVGVEDCKLPTRWQGITTNVVPLRKRA